jgi:DNA polymerase-3 subunit delta
MKLSPRDTTAYLQTPKKDATGLLIYGEDSSQIAIHKQDVIVALLGPDAEQDMRLTRLQAAQLRSDPGALLDAVKAVGFFPGPRAVVVEGATDGLAPILSEAITAWAPGDAQIIATANRLTARSALRKLFENANNAYAAAIYTAPVSRQSLETMLTQAGAPRLNDTAWHIMQDLAAHMPLGEIRQMIAKLALYKHGDSTPVSHDDILAVGPAVQDAELDDVLNATAEGQAHKIGPLLARLRDQGTQPVGMCIAATRHFKLLYTATCHPGGPSAGIAALRPPVFGPRRDRLQRQLKIWQRGGLEQALHLLVETDLALRNNATAPHMPMVERCLIRLAMMAARP